MLNRYSYTLNNSLKYTDPSGHIVRITDPDVSIAFSRLMRYGLDITSWMISSDMVFHIREISYIDESDRTPTIKVDLYTELRDEPIPVKYVPESSKQAKDLGKYRGKSTGYSFLWWEWGNVTIRYQDLIPQELEWLTRHEYFHYCEQTSEGLLWYFNYGVEYAARLLYYWDSTSAYRSLSDEFQARDYAGQPHPTIPDPLWKRYLDLLTSTYMEMMKGSQEVQR